ncbi:chemotaxis protein CheW [Janthinobacterium agaricidamnosum]|uniref:CheW-like domain protein n=1 Tax=Janthinobacterium agaricidamnosum NBRC 102515 = DSM 9628 TaxID=1349767 RepID=W0VB82_9BURK|nr:chemotaxis protein CheW [Janthinobacterium agaricidamnosum]CDG84517.1 cheW-like domain protein [Janthinobacterium agaricidamnosum NBRC 102515 = DSM 9628]
MKVLVFHIGGDRYGLRLTSIMRVLPLLELKQLPLAPDHVAGLMDLHGTSVPVIELSRLAGLPAAADHFDTRIVIVDYRGPDGVAHPLGLLASQVRGIRDIAPAALSDSGVLSAPFLGQVASDADGILQLIELEQLLPAALRAILFQPAPASSAGEAAA